ncbi:hypothetical protein KQX54_020892 [Cotesia glomerata]|uniref:Uncharacterized protein n=1 Tax=Cotesia glomerata TaxID=32391 RepID=A0AAV7I545_COTGL|nr:hypothetical protein KQX54_020892 [Cotesia glomerata]
MRTLTASLFWQQALQSTKRPHDPRSTIHLEDEILWALGSGELSRLNRDYMMLHLGQTFFTGSFKPALKQLLIQVRAKPSSEFSSSSSSCSKYLCTIHAII